MFKKNDTLGGGLLRRPEVAITLHELGLLEGPATALELGCVIAVSLLHVFWHRFQQFCICVGMTSWAAGCCAARKSRFALHELGLLEGPATALELRCVIAVRSCLARIAFSFVTELV